MRFYSVSDISGKLQKDHKQVRRYISQGELGFVEGKHGLLIPEKEINEFLSKKNSYDFLRGLFGDYAIKEAYVMRKHGANKSTLKEITNCSEKKLDYALDRYDDLRKRPLRALGVTNFDKYFLVSEVAARLRIKDPHVIKRMIVLGLLDAEIKERGPQTKNIIDAISFKNYLNSDLRNRYYTSNEASNKLELSVTRIDRVAKHFDIGRKILETKNSHYLFTKNDLSELKKKNKHLPSNEFNHIGSF